MHRLAMRGELIPIKFKAPCFVFALKLGALNLGGL